MKTILLSITMTIIVLFAYYYGKFKNKESIFSFIFSEGEKIRKEIQKIEIAKEGSIEQVKELAILSGRLNTVNKMAEEILGIDSMKILEKNYKDYTKK